MKDKNRNVEKVSLGRRIALLLMSAVVAIAVAALCIFVFDARGAVKAPVDEVTDGNVQTSATTYNNPANGGNYTTSIRNNDVFNFAYKGSYYYLTLPKGKYTVQVWGAQGGGCGNSNGGKGGYATGTMTLSANTTVYVYVGGRGTNSTGSIDGNHDSTRYAGGWNGGGNGSGSRGPGGGGATDIRLNSTSLSSRIIVAAGGGGGRTASYTEKFQSSGSLGQGASGCSSRHSSSYSNDEGGGGGGYYGGAVRHGDDPSASYCGSNYTGGVSGPSSVYGNNAAAGRAVITATDVNQNPSSKNPITSKGSHNRGAVNITVTPAEIATDPEGQTMYFTNGTANRYDDFTNGQTNLYINSSCTTLASDYLTWSATNSKFTITQIKRYPRNGYGGCTSDGRLQLWTRVRDSYGATATRGNAIVTFYIYVNKPATPTTVTTTLNAGDGNDFNDVYVGMSKITSNPQNATASNIYHPTTPNRYTALIAKPLRLSGTNKGVTITASALLGSLNTTYDQAVISLLDVSRINKNDASRIFKVNEYDNSTSVVRAYTPTGSAIANTFSQITIEGVNSNANYQVLKCRVYAVEKNSARGSYYQIDATHYKDIDVVFKVNNTRPTLKSGTSALVDVAQNGSASVSLADYYHDADGAISTSTHKITGVKVPTQEFLQVERFGKVVPTGGNYYNVLPYGSATPTKDDVSNAAANGELKSGYPTGFDPSFISTGVTNNAFIQYSYSGIAINIKGLRATSNKYLQRNAAEKRVVVSGGGDGLSSGSITAIGSGNIQSAANTANAGHFYILVHIQDMNDVDDTGIWLPLAIKVNNAAPTSIKTERGEAVNSTMPTASGTAGQSFYFTPMGITVNRVLNPIGQYNTASSGQALALTATNLRPLASDADNFLTADARNGSTLSPYTGKLNELITGASTARQVQDSVSANKTTAQYFSVEELNIYIPTAQLGGRVPTTSSDYLSGAPANYVMVRGYKITLKNWTHNRYMYATVNVKDSAGAPAAVQIAIFVNNEKPRTINESTDSTKIVTLNDTSNGATIRSTYDSDNNIITYEVPMKSKIVITPYDLLFDDNMRKSGIKYPAQGFTLNGLSGNLASGVFTVGATNGNNPIVGIARDTNTANNGYNYSSSTYLNGDSNNIGLISTLTQLKAAPMTSTDKFIASNNQFAAAATMSARYDKLFFERNSDKSNLDGYSFEPATTDFASPTILNSNYVSTEFGRVVKINNIDYPIDFFVIRAVQQTPDGGYAEIKLNVRDRTGSGATGSASGTTTITVRVKVLNSQPTLKNPSKIHTLSVDPVRSSDGTTVVTPNTITFSAAELLEDNEGNIPSFVVGSGVRVLDADGNGSVNGHNYLGEYVSVSLSAQSVVVTALNSSQRVKYLNIILAVLDDQGGDPNEVKLRVEILNSKLSINRDPVTGFEQNTETNDNYNLWSVNTKNKELSYYFASGATAASRYPSTQVRQLVTDSDALQGAVLTVAGNGKYINAPANASADDLKSYVPYVDTTTHENSPVGAVIKFSGDTLGTYIKDYDIEYYVQENGATKVYRASKLRDGTDADEKITDANKNLFFDENGRWIVTDWAIRVDTKAFFMVNTCLELTVHLRDDSTYGGDTAGVAGCGYLGGAAVGVVGKLVDTFRLFINDSTGIVPYDYYDGFGGLYVVTDDSDASKNYISTVYSDLQGGFTSTLNKDSIYMNSDRTVATGASGTTLLKPRSAGSNHGSTTGFDSGLEYGTASAEQIADIKNKGAFVYDHTIEVTSEKDGNGNYKYTYIPMSYFALAPSTVGFASDGTLTYANDRYVSYDISGNGYNRGTIAQLYDAISVTNGVDTWTGSVNTTTTKRLADCPYVGFTAYDATGLTDPTASEAYVSARNGKYFNNNIAISSVDDSGNSGNSGKLLEHLEKKDTNCLNLIGNGHAMYLYGQETKLQEHLFGLGIQKKTSRAGVNNLTITISVAMCANSTTGSGTVVNYSAETRAKNTAKVTYNLKIGNEKMDLFSGTGSDVKIDPATSQYYLDVNLTNGSGAYNIELARNSADVSEQSNQTVLYIDGDTDDKAYFYADSAKKLQFWSGNELYKRVGTVQSGEFTNTNNSASAQASVKHYFDNPDLSTFAVTSAYQPNPGKYGTNNGVDGSGVEGFSSFFSATVDTSGQRLTIFPSATTTLNIGELDAAAASSREGIVNYYKARGLVAEFSGSTSSATFKSAYYPYKILVYDSCGDGFGEGSYVALEVRVRISSAPLTLNGSIVDGSNPSRKSIKIKLPVSSAYSFSLKNVITDYELLSGSKGWYYKKDYETLKNTAKSVEDQFRLETGAYLLSPFATNGVSNGNITSDNNSLRQNSGTNIFSDLATDFNSQADVVMSMNFTDSTLSATAEPSDNNITIRVNRRTTYKDGSNRVVNKRNFIFYLDFKDSNDQTSERLYIDVEVENQNPMRRAGDEAPSEVTMRVSDSFSIITTPFDKFYDGGEAVEASNTWNRFITGNVGGSSVLAAKGSDNKPFYSKLTTESLTKGGNYALRDYTPGNPNQQELGYVAVADDDTPWGLRISGIECDDRYFNYSHTDDMTTEDGLRQGSLKYDIVAVRACRNMPITVTVIDGEGGTTTFTIHVTVTSSPPVAVSDTTNTSAYRLADGLEFSRDPNNDNKYTGSEYDGRYKLYMTADSGAKVKDRYETSEVTLQDGTKVNAYGHITIDVLAAAQSGGHGGIAYDPDVDDNAFIGLYEPPEGSDSSVFELNGIAMTSIGNYKFTDVDERYLITTNENYSSFVITCQSYDTLVDEDLLKFFIRDHGNDIPANATPVTISITTLYSAMTNAHQAGKTTGQGEGLTITGADTVHVKAYDKYVGNGMSVDDPEYNANVGQPSVYQFLRYNDMPDPVDQIASDSGAYIIDPDVAASSAALSYDVKVYALIDQNDGGTYKSKDLKSLAPLFDINRTTGYFKLKSQDTVSSYLIGGKDENGLSYDEVADNNRGLVAFVQQYFTFTIGADGVSLVLRPVTSNINVDILLYVEATKKTTRLVRPSADTPVSAGALFYVKVDDSAPLANTSEYNRSEMSFTGKVGDEHTFTIFDNEHPDSSMFTDSDMSDEVIVEGFNPNDSTNASYNAALADNECTDWRSGNGKPRAIDVSIDNVAHTLKVKIVRRVDMLDEDGNYMSEVPLTLNIKGKDKGGKESVVTLYITIQNSDFGLKSTALGEFYDDYGVGYGLVSNMDGYNFDLNIAVSKDRAAFKFENKFTDGSLISDPDYTTATANIDSFRLVNVPEDDENYGNYVTNDGLLVKNGDIEIATIKPQFYNGDHFRLTGFTVTAESYYRGYTGTAYMRVLDRAGDDSDTSTGVTFKITITLLNSAPFIKEGMETAEHFIIGTDAPGATLDPIDIDIAEFVDDPNPTDKADRKDGPNATKTYIRIVSTVTEAPTEIYGTGEDDSGSVFTVEINDTDARKCSIQPKRGFFGSQIVNITVSDGGYDESTDALSVTFNVKVTVVYNFDEIKSLKSVTAVRGMTKVIDINTVVAEIDNTATGNAKSAPRRLANGVSQSADEDGNSTFNPGAKYAISRLSAPPAYSQYVEIGQNEDGEWQFRAMRVTTNGEITLNVDIKLASELDNPDARTYTQSFIVNIVDNPKPELSTDFENRYYQFNTTQTGSNKYILDSDGSIQLTPSDLFTDNEGDIMKFVSVESSAPSLVSIEIKSDDSIILTFHAKGTAEIKITVADLTGESKAFALNVQNIDLEDPDLWRSIMISFETNMVLWISIAAAVLLLIIILIIVIVAVKRKKRKREEIEALLISEMELEEQMMRLAAPGSAPYASYGYLPPTVPVQNDPGLMLGSNAPGQTNNNVLNLNPGSDSNNGVPPGSDM